jgi:PAS domain S-box-containing protein
MADKPVNILLVEDNPGDVRLIQQMLAEAGAGRFELLHSRHLAGALQQLQQGPCDALLLDLNLPDSHGLETFDKVHAQTPNVPVLVLTGLDDEDLATQAVRAGAQDYLVKGQIDSQLLVRSVRYAIERARIQEALAAGEQRYRLFIKNLQGIAFQARMDFTPIFVHGAVEAIAGYTEQEFLAGEPRWHQIIHPQDLPGLSESLKTLRSVPNYLDEREYRIVRKDTQVRWVHEFIQNIADDSGKPALVQGAIYDITERKQAEEALKLHELRIQALLDLNKMAGATQQEILDFVRERIIEITQSQFAFVGFVNDDESAMTMDNWSKDTMAQCAVSEKPIHFPITQAGLWADAVRQRKPLIVNDYSADHPGKKGCPKGHVPVERLLCVPVFDGEDIVAVAAVANKRTDYEEPDVRALTSMMNDAWRLVQRKHTAEALQKSEVNYRTIFNTVNDAIFVHDTRNGKIISANDKACEMFGYAQEEFHELTVEDISLGEPPYTQQKAIGWIKKAVRQGPQLFEWICKNKAGKTFWVEVNLKLAVIEGAERMLAIVRNISERKATQLEIENLAKFPSEDPYPVLRISKDYTIVYANNASSPVLETWGCKQGQRLPDPCSKRVEAALSSGKVSTFEFECSNGQIFLVTLAPVANLGYINVYGVDITERKQAIEALQESERRFRTVFERAGEPLYLIEPETGRFVDVNQRSCDALGYTRQELLGLSVPDIDLVYPKEQFVKFVRTLKKGKPVTIEATHQRKDGTTFPVEIRTGFIEIMGETRLLSLVRDISERKDAELRQQLATKILARLNQISQRRELVRDVLALIKETIELAAAAIRLRQGDDFPYFQVDGFSDDFVKSENYLCARDDNGELIRDAQGQPVVECMCGAIITGSADSALPFITDGGAFWTNSTSELLQSASLKEQQVATRNRCNLEGYESVALIPLRSGDEVVGLLQLNDTKRGRFTAEMMRFFEGIGASIGIALARISAEQEVENLAKFPSESPYPVVRIAKGGTILYANDAALKLLDKWGCQLGGLAPQNWRQYVQRILDSGSSGELETTCEDRVFSLIIAPVADAGYVNVYGIDVTERRQAEEELRKYRLHLEELVEARTAELTQTNEQLLKEIERRHRLEREILEISERERRRIGQELHDSIGQQFTGIAFMTKVLEKKLAKGMPKESASAAEIGKLVNQATDQVRGLARGLHSVDLDAGGLALSLAELAANTEHLFGIHCSFQGDDSVQVDDTSVAVNLYRITQEAVTNAVKHGKAKNIRITLTCRDGKYVLTVENDGEGFPGTEAGGKGLGLQIMGYRAEIIDGSLELASGAKGGTIVTCSLPGKRAKGNSDKPHDRGQTAS